MRRITTSLLAVAAGLTLASAALATTLPTSAAVITRVFDDCPISVLSVTNNYPTQIVIDDQNQPPQPLCGGFANLHVWRFSTDGTTPIQFQNGDIFEYSAEMVLNGGGEGGLSLAPWYGQNSDGLFNVKTTDGEIACFGGRLPFYSFSAAPTNLRYTNNTPIWLSITYNPRDLSPGLPAQVTYRIRYNGMDYTSGPLNFDLGNPAEDPPHGLWGALTPWYGGGHMKMFLPAGQPHGITGTWSNISTTDIPVPAKGSSWGQIKALYR